MSQAIGYAIEEQAKHYLVAQGLKLIASNFRSKMGEIDLIMRDGPCLVFVEVRARRSASFGGALSSVTFRKQQKLIKTASYFLMKYKIKEQHPIRFDVVSFEGSTPEINWVKNAFGENF